MPQGVYVRTEEHKRNLGLALRGKKRTEAQIRRMSEAHKGIPSNKKGKHFPQFQGAHSTHWKGGKPHCADCGKEMLSYEHKRCQECHLQHVWKGTKVHIETLHQWVKARKPKTELCECCHKVQPLDCANISGHYLRDISDYEWLCRRCHMVKDGRLQRLIERLKSTGVHVVF